MGLNISDFEEKHQLIIEKVFDAYCEHFGLTNKINVDVCYVTAEEIKELNAENRGVDAVTDVLSFPNIDNIELPLNLKKYKFDVNPEDGRLELGSVVICIDRLKEQAIEYGNTFERELSYLTVHSLLHLLSYDHETDTQKKEMRALEELILQKANLGEI